MLRYLIFRKLKKIAHEIMDFQQVLFFKGVVCLNVLSTCQQFQGTHGKMHFAFPCVHFFIMGCFTVAI